jgi:monoamine oxidase
MELEIKKEIVIIGAGVSGLAAAYNLNQSNFKVTVIEARNRLGGRINTVLMGNQKIDMGASWIHGIGPNVENLKKWRGKLNPIYKLAQENSISTIPTWEDEENARISYYWYKLRGRKVDEEYINDYMENVEDFVDSKIKKTPHNASLNDIISKFKYGSAKYRALNQSIINFMYIQDSAAELSEMSLVDYHIPWKFDGPEHVFPEGYMQIIDLLSRDLNIILNKVVSSIDYSEEKVIIKTADGDSFCCDHVLVTVPVSVLQSRSINFNPPLSEEKMNAIDRFGMGVMDKLWLEFSEPFWINDLNSDWICYASENIGFWVNTLNYYKYTGKPILLMFISAQAALVASRMNDEEILESAMKAIRDWYPNAPDYIRYARSNWSQDQFSKGSFPFSKVGIQLNDFESYRESDSTRNKVYFAGDATMIGMVGCVHGAFISGIEISIKMMEDAFNIRNT